MKQKAMPAANAHPVFPLRHAFTPPEHMPATSLLPLWRRIHQELMIRAQKWELPSNVCMVLMHVHLHPEDSEPAAVAAANQFPRQTVTFLLDTLEKKGLAVRKPHPNDRRRKRIQLTPKGQHLAETIFQDVVRFESSALRKIEDVDLPRLQSFLTRYADALATQNDIDLKT
jgi:DNA-binding MarR family transcriptional regulator